MASPGDVFQQFGSVNAAAYLEVRPASGNELVIHNVYHAQDIDLKLVDAAGHECDFMAESGKNVITNIYLHLTNAQYLRVYNIAGTAQYVAVDGIYTKAA